MDPRKHLLAGQVIPAHPLALEAGGRFSERHQRALTRYYLEAGVGGLAVGVHSTQFEIRQPEHALYRPVLELAARTLREERPARPVIMVAGVCGNTAQALAEAELARGLGYHAGLLSLGAVRDQGEDAIVAHCRQVAKTIPLIGFYLQPAVGGRVFPYEFWRKFAEIPELLAIKIAPFNRYQTIDVVRAVVAAGREDVALYTGNDDTIVTDLLTPFAFTSGAQRVVRRIVGGLLGHWGVWTHSAVKLFEEIKALGDDSGISRRWLERGVAVTDMNAAVFDPAHGFEGCIPGILEVLRRQGLLPTNRCLNPHEVLSPGQAEELTRVSQAYPELIDDDFVAANRDRWLS